MPGPHDALVKWTFGQPERAAKALKAILPRELAAAFNWPTLRVEPGSFVDEALKERHSDLLFSLEILGGGEARLYVLFEHQSTDDPMMPFRLLRYMVRIWEQVLGETPAVSGLPIIVPVVLHTGPRSWNASISFAALLEADPELLEAAAPYIPDFRFVLDDLGGTSDEELRRRAVDAVTRLVLIALRHGRSELQDSTVLEWVDLLEEVFDAPNGLDAVRRVLAIFSTSAKT